ncbi:nitrous oxide reductase accessory protein NosL [Natronomonas amylolytica]|uniref:nitrous oxide reductase accessory protein NosL n=1 Tax=Natronomonas amylolytica TaxID=3108498 RepID=UPI00300BD341
MLRDTAGLGAVALAGCLGGGEETPAETPDPIALDDGRTCDVCGMVIAEGYGPNGQVAYDGDYPPDREGPAHYDSVRELYADRFAQADRGTDALVTYVTDYSTVDYELETRDGDRYITGSVAADTFAEAAEVVFVVDSGVQGAMGADFPALFSAERRRGLRRRRERPRGRRGDARPRRVVHCCPCRFAPSESSSDSRYCFPRGNPGVTLNKRT